MTISGTVKNIFLAIANRLGLTLSEKTNTLVDYTEAGLNPTAIGSGVITNIAIDDSDIVISGENARADAIREAVDYYTDEVQYIACEVSLGTGDALVRPYTDGEKIGFNVIGNEDFVITESIGQALKGIIIKLDEYKTNTATYRLFESQTLKDLDGLKVVIIRRFAYKDDDEISVSSTVWSGMREEDIITADSLLIGRYKCPTINRENYNSANGVPITFGCEDIVENIKQKYFQYNDEFDRKEALIFADRTLFKRDDKGELNLTSNHELVKLRGGMNDGNVSDMIQDYSPAIRETEFQAGNNFNLSILELCCGFSRGVFTSPETSFATATEMKNSLKKTFAFVKKFRRRIEAGNKQLFNAVNILMNLNSTTPMGEWDIQHQWSYDYIEQTQEKFNQLLQSHAIGAVKTEDVTAWVLDMPRDEAEEYVAEIQGNDINE